MSGRGAKSGTGEERERGAKSGEGATSVDSRNGETVLALESLLSLVPLFVPFPRVARGLEGCA